MSSCTCRWPRRAARHKHPAVCLPAASPAPSPSRLCSECHYTLFLCATSRGPAKPQGVHCSLKTCSYTHLSTSCCPSHPHLLSALLPSGSSAVCGSITFWRSSTPAPLGPHNIVPGPGSCYSPTYHRLQHVPGKPSLSLFLFPSVCVLHKHPFSLFLIPSLLLSLPRPTLCCSFPQFASRTHATPDPSLSLTPRVWYLQNVEATQPIDPRDRKQKTHVVRVDKQKTLTT